jgi:hypothetical protein
MTLGGAVGLTVAIIAVSLAVATADRAVFARTERTELDA